MKSVYDKNIFDAVKKSPFFYSNFVMTIDGKIQVLDSQSARYWPIGSKLDFDTLLWLRAHADVLIHGKNTALGFNTLKTLGKKELTAKRKKLGKKNKLIYMVLSNHPDDKLLNGLKNPPPEVKSCILKGSDLKGLVRYFRKNKLHKILVEGGPTLMASFLKENLIDEMFVTIAPKIFGNSNNKTITMVENHLFAPDKVPQFKLLSAKNINNELYLRYRR